MADKFGGQKDGRQSTGASFYDVPTVTVNANALYFPNFPASPFFGVAEYPVAAGDLGAFSTSGVFVFDKPVGWIDNPGRKVFYRPKTAATGEIVAQEIKGDVLIGYQIVDNINPQKLGVLLAPPEFCMNILMVTSTADSGAGSLRQTIADAQDGDVILFDADVFPVGQTTSILLSSYITITKSVSIYGGASDGNGGYTSGATKEYYVYRDIDGVKTKVVISSPDDAQEGETVLFENVCRVALDGQGAVRCAYTTGGVILWSGIGFIGGLSATYGGGAIYSNNYSQNTLNDCTITGCSATNGGGVYSASTSQNTLNDCTITGCSANYGGGVYIGNSSSVTLNDCEITQNTANNGGGLCSYNQATANINNCIIKDNITTTTDQTQKDVSIISTSFGNITASEFGALRISQTATVTFVSGVTTAQIARFLRQYQTSPTITINDGAALSITESATIVEETVFTSSGRGYLAVAAGIDTSAATLTNVVLCSYGAGLESFDISADGATWTADDLTTPILIETRDAGGDWQTLTDNATGGEYATTFALESTARAFDGVAFFVATLPGYWQAGDAGAVESNDWSVRGFAAANSNGGGGVDAAQGWTVTPSTVTPNADGV